MTKRHSLRLGSRENRLRLGGANSSVLPYPRGALADAGIETKIVSDKPGEIQGMHHADKGDRFTVDATLAESSAADFDAIVIPGGLFSPDALRTNETALRFVRDFFAERKVVSAICHGPQVLISANVVRNREMTAVPAVQTDLRNAGAIVHNDEMVCDQGLVTSRVPDDLPAFNAKLIEEIEEGRHGAQRQSL